MSQVKALILNERSFADYDKILVLLTEDDEKITAIAKGVKKPLAKLISIIRPLAVLGFKLVGRGNIKTIAGAELKDNFAIEPTRLDKMALAFYVLELTDYWLEEKVRVAGAFKLLTEVLQAISRTENLPLLRSYFELKTLEILGRRPQLERCVVSDQVLQASEVMYFSARSGGIVASEFADAEKANRVSVQVIKLMRLMLENDWDFIDKITGFTKKDINQLREVVGQMMAKDIHKNLRSLNFWNKINELS